LGSSVEYWFSSTAEKCEMNNLLSFTSDSLQYVQFSLRFNCKTFLMDFSSSISLFPSFFSIFNLFLPLQLSRKNYFPFSSSLRANKVELSSGILNKILQRVEIRFTFASIIKYNKPGRRTAFMEKGKNRLLLWKGEKKKLQNKFMKLQKICRSAW
jgi:hypothetical protein